MSKPSDLELVLEQYKRLLDEFALYRRAYFDAVIFIDDNSPNSITTKFYYQIGKKLEDSIKKLTRVKK